MQPLTPDVQVLMLKGSYLLNLDLLFATTNQANERSLFTGKATLEASRLWVDLQSADLKLAILAMAEHESDDNASGRVLTSSSQLRFAGSGGLSPTLMPAASRDTTAATPDLTSTSPATPSPTSSSQTVPDSAYSGISL
jgi:hypothetical protein